MIATTHVAFDLLFVVHLMVALALVVVLVTMRLSAASVTLRQNHDISRRRFPNRVNWAARVVHLAPLSGLAVVATGGSSDSLSHAWTGLGLFGYFVAAGLLEARALPSERELATALRASDEVPVDVARRLVRQLDEVLVIIAFVMIVMVLQP